jgi:hypothetical protein
VYIPRPGFVPSGSTITKDPAITGPTWYTEEDTFTEGLSEVTIAAVMVTGGVEKLTSSLNVITDSGMTTATHFDLHDYAGHHASIAGVDATAATYFFRCIHASFSDECTRDQTALWVTAINGPFTAVLNVINTAESVNWVKRCPVTDNIISSCTYFSKTLLYSGDHLERGGSLVTSRTTLTVLSTVTFSASNRVKGVVVTVTGDVGKLDELTTAHSGSGSLSSSTTSTGGMLSP